MVEKEKNKKQPNLTKSMHSIEPYSPWNSCTYKIHYNSEITLKIFIHNGPYAYGLLYSVLVYHIYHRVAMIYQNRIKQTVGVRANFL